MSRRLFRNKWSYTESYDSFEKIVDDKNMSIQPVPDSNGWCHVARGLMYGYVMFEVFYSQEEKYRNYFKLVGNVNRR